MEKVFSDNEVNMVYSMYDRMVVGGAKPMGDVYKRQVPSSFHSGISSLKSYRSSTFSAPHHFLYHQRILLNIGFAYHHLIGSQTVTSCLLYTSFIGFMAFAMATGSFAQQRAHKKDNESYPCLLYTSRCV